MRTLAKNTTPLALVGLAFLVLVFFLPAATLQGVFFLGDTSYGYFPRLVYTSNALASGRVPLWNPLVSLGAPQIADPAALALYPVSLLLFTLLPDYIAYNYLVLLHIFLAAAFTFGYCRLIGLSNRSAVFGALAYAFGGWMLTHLEHINVFIGAVYLPLLFSLIELALRQVNWRRLPAGAILIALYLLGAHSQMPLFAAVGLGLYLVLRLFVLWRETHNTRALVIPLAGLAVVGGLGAGLAAIQLLPMAQAVLLSSRSGGVGADIALGYSFPPEQLLTFIAPYFFGGPNGFAYWGRSTFREMMAYAGVLPFAFALIGMAQLRKNRYAAILTAVLVLALLLAMGRYTPLYVALASLPLFDLVRYPPRFLFLAAFTLAVLAGIGLEALIRRRDSFSHLGRVFFALTILGAATIVGFNLFLWQRATALGVIGSLLRFYPGSKHPAAWYYDLMLSIFGLNRLVGLALFVFLVSGLGLVALYLARRLTVNAFIVATLGLTAADLFVFNLSLPYNTTMNPQIYTQPPRVAQFLQNDHSLYRIYYWATDDDQYNQQVLPKIQKGDYSTYVELLREGLRGSFNTLYSIASLTGYGTEDNRHFEVMRQIGGIPAYDLAGKDAYRHTLDVNLLSLMNGKYLTTMETLNDSRLTLVFQSGLINVYRNEAVLPRAFIASRVRVITAREQLLQVLSAEDFDARHTVLLDQDPGLNSDAPSSGEVSITRYAPEEIELSAELTQPGVLVLGDTFYPGWRVEVDGTPHQILKADYILRGVALPAGRHRIRFYYAPEEFTLGCALSGLSIAILLGLVSLGLVRTRLKPHLRRTVDRA